MTRLTISIALAATPLALSACATTGSNLGPTEVSRYNLGTPIAPGTVAVEPAPGSMSTGLDYNLYADAVVAEMARIGFAPALTGTTSQYIASVAFTRSSRGAIQTPPKFTIGLGGGSFGGGRRGGVGLGGGVSTGIGSRTREVYMSELFVQLRRRSDGTVVWEGRAQRPGMSGQPDTQPNATAARLANALFRGFPGESGITTTVK